MTIWGPFCCSFCHICILVKWKYRSMRGLSSMNYHSINHLISGIALSLSSNTIPPHGVQTWLALVKTHPPYTTQANTFYVCIMRMNEQQGLRLAMVSGVMASRGLPYMIQVQHRSSSVSSLLVGLWILQYSSSSNSNYHVHGAFGHVHPLLIWWNN